MAKLGTVHMSVEIMTKEEIYNSMCPQPNNPIALSPVNPVVRQNDLLDSYNDLVVKFNTLLDILKTVKLIKE
jgi:hypothetical protein